MNEDFEYCIPDDADEELDDTAIWSSLIGNIVAVIMATFFYFQSKDCKDTCPSKHKDPKKYNPESFASALNDLKKMADTLNRQECTCGNKKSKKKTKESSTNISNTSTCSPKKVCIENTMDTYQADRVLSVQKPNQSKSSITSKTTTISINRQTSTTSTKVQKPTECSVCKQRALAQLCESCCQTAADAAYDDKCDYGCDDDPEDDEPDCEDVYVCAPCLAKANEEPCKSFESSRSDLKAKSGTCITTCTSQIRTEMVDSEIEEEPYFDETPIRYEEPCTNDTCAVRKRMKDYPPQVCCMKNNKSNDQTRLQQQNSTCSSKSAMRNPMCCQPPKCSNSRMRTPVSPQTSRICPGAPKSCRDLNRGETNTQPTYLRKTVTTKTILPVTICYNDDEQRKKTPQCMMKQPQRADYQEMQDPNNYTVYAANSRSKTIPNQNSSNDSQSQMRRAGSNCPKTCPTVRKQSGGLSYMPSGAVPMNTSANTLSVEKAKRKQ